MPTGPVPLGRYGLYFALALVGAAVDLVTKEATFRWLGPPGYTLKDAPPQGSDRVWWLWQDHFGIQTSLNQGALFGVGAGYSLWFALLSIAAGVAVVIWLFYFRAAHDRWLTFALGLITAGILGNLFDRLGLYSIDGLRPEYTTAVRDWILFQAPETKLKMLSPWPNFNLADSYLVVGAAMLVWHSLWQRPEPVAAVAAK